MLEISEPTTEMKTYISHNLGSLNEIDRHFKTDRSTIAHIFPSLCMYGKCAIAHLDDKSYTLSSWIAIISGYWLAVINLQNFCSLLAI